ncbi:hypothetical protein RND71_035453 [Anisodus tanguticus]|uniref:Potassium channel n=1 Tax=Anisodus tanguticus TaxID=243964 RepID=A0AAE1UVV1_9SOLA|nr:hypothetical protein RND71_035453 [Anisodus tanguticus]
MSFSYAKYSAFFSSDLLPSLGTKINQETKLRKYIISPLDPRYRAWEMFLLILVIYTAWITPFEFAFLIYKIDALVIFDNIVNCLFAIDIFLNFFMAYLDKESYILVDDPKKIAIRYLSTWFIFDVCSTVPFPAFIFIDHKESGVGFKLLSMLRLWRLRRVSALFARLEKDIRFNYFWTRYAKLISDFPYIEGLPETTTLPPKVGVPEMEAEYFPPKEDVILQNEAQADLYVIVSGALDLLVDIDGNEQIVGKAVAGESFGERGILFGKPQPYAVRTTEISQILCLRRKTLLNILRDNPEDERIIMRNLVLKLQGFGGFDNVERDSDASLVFNNQSDTPTNTIDPIRIDIQNLEARAKKQVENEGESYGCNMHAYSGNENGQKVLDRSAVSKGRIEMAPSPPERRRKVKGWIAKAQAKHGGNKSMHELLSSYDNDIELNEQKGNFIRLDEDSRSSQFKPSRNQVPCCSSYSGNTSQTGAKETKSIKKRVTIHMKKNNSLQEHNGKLIILPDTLEELFRIACQRFGEYSLKKVVNAEDVEIDEVDVIRDGDHLFFSFN